MTDATPEALAAKLGRPVTEQEFVALSRFVEAADNLADELPFRPGDLDETLDRLAEALALEVPGIDAAGVKAWLSAKARRRRGN